MGILVKNSDFELLWGEEYPSIAFDNTSYSLAGEVGTTLSASFAVFDNNDEDVTDQCEITLSNDNVSIENGMFICDDLEVGTYTTEVTATYSYLSATVTATATINISVEEEQATSIAFSASTYSMNGSEYGSISKQFSVSDNLGNDITTLCAYSFLPNDKGLYAEGGYFKVDSATAGIYSITVTATYGELTNTATISMAVVDYPDSISFDSNSYSMSGTEGDTITQAFTVTDDLSHDVTANCVITFSPNNTGLTASNGAFDASSVAEGTYSVTATATYQSGNGTTLTATATISMEIESASFADKYLTFEALESGTFTLTVPASVDSTKMTSISYSTDDGTTWVDTTIDNTAQTITTPTIAQGGKVLWKGIGSQLANSDMVNSHFSSTGNFNVSGNIMSLLYGDNFENQTSFASGSQTNFNCLFRDVTNGVKIISAKNLTLPATTLTYYCYGQMFNNCNLMTTAPKVLPATTLAPQCYASMFSKCTSLTAAPSLPATNLTGGTNCYKNMFQSCRALTTPPELPATTLEQSCYYQMFLECGITTVPVLPATTLANGCYDCMFQGCYNLTTLPANMLPATTMTPGCYRGMFKESGLITVPSDLLPATTLAQNCYGSATTSNINGMFYGCTALTTAPDLPATTLANGCYAQMFYGCTSLTTTPTISATTLAEDCCWRMFRDCTSLTTAVLPAPTLVKYSYQSMFQYCSNLTSITMLATDISAQGCLQEWVTGVAATGTFTKAASQTSLPSGINGIPEGWTVVDYSE